MSCDAKLIQGFAPLSLLELREVQQIYHTANNFANKVTYGSEKAFASEGSVLFSLKNQK